MRSIYMCIGMEGTAVEDSAKAVTILFECLGAFSSKKSMTDCYKRNGYNNIIWYIYCVFGQSFDVRNYLIEQSFYGSACESSFPAIYTSMTTIVRYLAD